MTMLDWFAKNESVSYVSTCFALMISYADVVEIAKGLTLFGSLIIVGLTIIAKRQEIKLNNRKLKGNDRDARDIK